MSFLLKINKWILFFICGGLAISVKLFYFVFQVENEHNSFLNSSFYIFAGFSIISWLCWTFSIGRNLNKTLKRELRLKTGFFKFAYIYIIIYSFLIIFFWIKGKIDPIGREFIYFMPSNMMLMALFYYIASFCGKVIKTIDKNQEVWMTEYSEEAALILTSPIGILKMQPKINKLYSDSRKAQSAQHINKK